MTPKNRVQHADDHDHHQVAAALNVHFGNQDNDHLAPHHLATRVLDDLHGSLSLAQKRKLYRPDLIADQIPRMRLVPGHPVRGRLSDVLDHVFTHSGELRPVPGKVGSFSVREAVLAEVAPPGFKGTVKAMKRKHGFSNQKAYALAWSMKNQGDRSHYKADGTHKNEGMDEARRTKRQATRYVCPHGNTGGCAQCGETAHDPPEHEKVWDKPKNESAVSACPQCGAEGRVQHGRVLGHSNQFKLCPASYKKVDDVGQPPKRDFLSWYTSQKESVDEAFVTREQLLRDYVPNPVTLEQLRTGTYNEEGSEEKRAVAREHQLNVARRTLKMPDAMVGVMGGMTKDQARKIVQNHAGSFASRVRGFQDTDESLRLVQPGSTGWRDKSFGDAERRQKIRAHVQAQGTVHGRQSERVLKNAAAAVQRGRMKEDINATWDQLVDEKTKDPLKYELMYSGGGHGGPYLGAQAAYKGAKRMLKGGSDRAITIARYAEKGEPGLYIPRFTMRRDGTSARHR